MPNSSQSKIVDAMQTCYKRRKHIKKTFNLQSFLLQSVCREEDDLANRACLIDEVDVLFAGKFYGNTYDGGFRLASPEAGAFLLCFRLDRRPSKSLKRGVAG